MASVLDSQQVENHSETRTFTFTLILSGFKELTDEVEKSIYDAGCDDGLVGIVDGEPFVDFDREAPSFREAVMTAIRDVESAGQNIRVIRVEPQEASFLRHLNAVFDLREIRNVAEVSKKAEEMLLDALRSIVHE